MRITLVGSTRFAALFTTYMEELTLRGHTVYGLGFNSSHKEDGEGKGPTEEQKVILDLVHLKKIMDSDAVVLVTDETLYFGQSTQRELAWAMLLDKPTHVGTEGLGTEAKLITPDELRMEFANRKAMQNEALGIVPLGALLRRRMGLDDLDTDDEGIDSGKPN